MATRKKDPADAPAVDVTGRPTWPATAALPAPPEPTAPTAPVPPADDEEEGQNDGDAG